MLTRCENRRFLNFNGLVCSIEYYQDYMNARDLHKKFLLLMRNNEVAERQHAFRLAEKNYQKASQRISERLAKLFLAYDDLYIIFGQAFLLTVTETDTGLSSSRISSYLLKLKALICRNILFLVLFQSIGGIILLLFQPIRLISISLSIPFLGIFPLFLMQSGVCELYDIQSSVYTGYGLLIWVILSAICFLITLSIQIIYKLWCHKQRASVSSLNTSHSKQIVVFTLFGVVFQAISTTSSSFIEEEHQIWYYFINTILIWFCWLEIKILRQKQLKSDAANQLVKPMYLSQLEWIVIFGGHLIARRLNQTGDKWLSVPDIGDWLRMSEHRLCNSLFVGCALIAMHLAAMDYSNILTNVLTLTASILIYYYRSLTGSVFLAGIKASE